jgi:hypothetical protein
MTRTLRLIVGCSLSVIVLVTACTNGGGRREADTGSDREVLAAVTKALETKNGWRPGSATVTLDGIEGGRFAHGGVRDANGSGALWFASLVDGSWQIVWDGNGIVDCARLEPHPDYPASLLPQCVKSDGSLQSRG